MSEKADKYRTFDYFTAPELYDDGENGRKLRMPAHEFYPTTQVAVGSDLTVTVGWDPESLAWMVDAFDSDGNWLTCLATVHVPSKTDAEGYATPSFIRGLRPDSTMIALAVDTAVRLFPNHLLTPL